jgi:hypothetical protein
MRAAERREEEPDKSGDAATMRAAERREEEPDKSGDAYSRKHPPTATVTTEQGA